MGELRTGWWLVTPRNVCRREFMKLSIFPWSTDYHLINLDQKNQASENSN